MVVFSMAWPRLEVSDSSSGSSAVTSTVSVTEPTWSSTSTRARVPALSVTFGRNSVWKPSLVAVRSYVPMGSAVRT